MDTEEENNIVALLRHDAESVNEYGFGQDFEIAADEIERFRKTLEELRQKIKHHDCEGDCYYSCPKSGGCCNKYIDTDHCDCGADALHEIIDNALKYNVLEDE